jgi:hypothetical protein
VSEEDDEPEHLHLVSGHFSRKPVEASITGGSTV